MPSSTSAFAPARQVIADTLKKIYLSGTHGQNRYIKHRLGQPRVVIAITGGGGAMFSEMFGIPGASSTILEAVVPYGKNSCLDFLKRQNRNADGIGFCSEDMAWQLANSARDRALELENDLNRWPDVHGVGCTATIVSHYQRRGGYRVHAAAVNSTGVGHTYTHQMTKGARNRTGEDLSCALLACRALADSIHLPFAAETGVRVSEKENENVLGCLLVNEVGEKASGVEEIPTRCQVNQEQVKKVEGGSYILAGPLKTKVLAPRGKLPEGSIIVSCNNISGAKHAAQTAKMALEVLGRQGDANTGAWSVMPSPVFLVCDDDDGNNVYDVAKDVLENVGVMVLENVENQSENQSEEDVENQRENQSEEDQSENQSEDQSGAGLVPSSGHMRAARAYPDATHVVEYNNNNGIWNNLLDDGSPSTIGVGGVFVGSVTASAADEVREDGGVLPLPHGEGIMTWDNGISYQGSWCDGVFHGLGAKMYSKGGGYIGRWKFGKREGLGISLYEGKWNYDQWEGPFKNDKSHGMGIMRPIEGEPFPFEFVEGQPKTLQDGTKSE